LGASYLQFCLTLHPVNTQYSLTLEQLNSSSHFLARNVLQNLLTKPPPQKSQEVRVMTKRVYKIQGRVVAQDDPQNGVSGLRVEAWDKDLLVDDYLGYATTDEAGDFTIEFDEDHYRRYFIKKFQEIFDRYPDLYFKVFQDGRLLADTHDKVIWNAGWQTDPGSVTTITPQIEVDAFPSEPAPSPYRVQGTVLDPDRKPLAGYHVEAWDRDVRSSQLLGQADTDDQGQFTIPYTPPAFSHAESWGADLTFRLLDPNGQAITDFTVQDATGQEIPLAEVVDEVEEHGGTSLVTRAIPLWFNAPAVATVTLIPGVAANRSEYERLVSRLQPLLVPSLEQPNAAPLRHGQLQEADIAFLVQETGFHDGRITALRGAAQLAAEINLTLLENPDWSLTEAEREAAFYGFTRTGHATTRNALLAEEHHGLKASFAKALADNLIPTWLAVHQDNILQALKELAAADPEIPPPPPESVDAQQDALRQLGVVGNVDVTPVIDHLVTLDAVNDASLKTLVDDDFIAFTDADARKVGLGVSLYRLCDRHTELAKIVQQEVFPDHPEPLGLKPRLKALTALSQQEWQQKIDQSGITLPEGMDTAQYAAILHKKAEKLFPTDALFQRLLPNGRDEVTPRIRELQPLFAHNPSVFKTPQFLHLNLPDNLEFDNANHLHQAHTELRRLANRYRGLRLRQILDDHQLDADAKARAVNQRLSLLTRFRQANPDAEVLAVDYTLDGNADTELQFDDSWTDEDKGLVVSTLKDYQRVYALTQDIEQTQQIIEADTSDPNGGSGYTSGYAIVGDGYESFLDNTHLHPSSAERIYNHAQAVVANTTSLLGTALELYTGDFDQLYAGNSDGSAEAYFQQTPGWKQLFGERDYCCCDHRRSILSPAAYFVDLLFFVEKHLLAPNFADQPDHPIHLKTRREDLWDLELTPENTDTLVPYLDLSNVILENYLAKLHDFTQVGNRDAIEALVYGELLYPKPYPSDQPPPYPGSFQQPFLLPLAKLHLYLSHFGVTRGEIAQLLDVPEEDQAAAILQLSKQVSLADGELVEPKREYELIDQAWRDLEFLRAVYGLPFKEVNSKVEFWDPDLDEDNNEDEAAIAASKNDVQLFLKATGLLRAELAELDALQEDLPFALFTIQGEKADDDSVQPDIERIEGLSLLGLDFIHRFVRLWRCLPWSMGELGLAIAHLFSTGLVSASMENALRHIATLRCIQDRFGLSVEQLCPLWSNIPEIPVQGGTSLCDLLFNQPPFVDLDGELPRSDRPFLHPAFRTTPPQESDPTLNRLLAGLRVSADGLKELIVGLRSPLEIDPESSAPEDKQFLLTIQNLSRLYRHARLAKLLSLSIPQLFQLINLLPEDNLQGHIETLEHLTALLKFYDEWQTTPYSLDDLGFITHGPVVNDQNYPDPASISQQIVAKVAAEDALTFADTVFASIPGINEAQSRAIVAAHPYIEATRVYRLTAAFDTATLVIPNLPDPIGVTAADLRQRLEVLHHSGVSTFTDTVFSDPEDSNLTAAQSRVLVTANPAIIEPVFAETVYWLSDNFIPSERIPVFTDTVFASLDGVTEAQSQIVVATQAGWLEDTQIPDGTAYRLSDAFNPADNFLPFIDTIFAHLEGITEDQSRAIIANNPDVILAVPNAGGVIYHLAETFSSSTPITLPEDIADSEEEIKGLLLAYQAAPSLMKAYFDLANADIGSILRAYHAIELIPAYLATPLGLSVEKTKALIDLANIDLIDPNFTQILQGFRSPVELENVEDAPGELEAAIAQLLPLTVLFQDDAFGDGALQFIDENVSVFDISNFSDLSVKTVMAVSRYRHFIAQGDDPEERLAIVNRVLQRFNPGTVDPSVPPRFYPTSDESNHPDPPLKDQQEDLANTLEIAWSKATVLHEEIGLPCNALQALDKLHRCSDLCKKIGVDGITLKRVVANDYAQLNQASTGIFAIFEEKYPDEQVWEDKIEPFENKIRGGKRDALLDYFIASHEQANEVTGGLAHFKSPTDLYYYFLIDSELEGCARTSPLVAAISSVQLYVHRVLINLEQYENAHDPAQTIHVVFPERYRYEWEWRKNYRVWEANRKVFLFPENWIEPDLRSNKTPLFQDLESDLLQREITAESVTEAYATYLKGFDEVAHLKIAGSYHEKDARNQRDTLHLFGVTADDPPVYYYRAVENAYYGELKDTKKERQIVWNPWQKVDVQIPVRKVSPIVFRGRLYDFWVEITTSPTNKLEAGNSKFTGYRHKMKLKYTVLQSNGAWSPPQQLSLTGYPFEDDGIINDPLFNLSPIYDDEEHLEPKDEYLLTGYKWDRVYPTIYQSDDCIEQIRLTGRDWKIVSAMIDFDIKTIQLAPLTWANPTNWKNFYLSLLQSMKVGSHSFLCCINPGKSFLDNYAFSTLLAERKRLYDFPGGLHTDDLIREIQNFRDQLAVILVAEFREKDKIHVINGSIQDVIIDSGDDLLLLQGSVREGTNYLLRRLGTTCAKSVSKMLFTGGIESLLSLAKQATLKESPSPITIIGDYITDAVIKEDQKGLDFSGPYGTYYRELFFHVPFLIANHLNSQQKFADAQKWYHYIFDPTARPFEADDLADTPNLNEKNRFWRYIEFHTHEMKNLRQRLQDDTALAIYKRDPFNPHAIAQVRLGAYQKTIVLKYIDNLLDWGDHLFAQDTMESINEATLLYVLALDILGERPQVLGECPTESLTYNKLELAPDPDQEESSSEILVEFEHTTEKCTVQQYESPVVRHDYTIDPTLASSLTTPAHNYELLRTRQSPPQKLAVAETPTSNGHTGNTSTRPLATEPAPDDSRPNYGLCQGLDWQKCSAKLENPKIVTSFGMSLMQAVRFKTRSLDIENPKADFAFCIPENKYLKQYWDRVEDRLYKIRNCMNISGVRRELALFAPEIDPGLLVRAKAAGLTLEDVLNSVSGNLPPYRFSYLIEKAKQYASTLQSFGSTLLSALEKKDTEELSRLQTAHQENILKLTTKLKEQDIQAAEAGLEVLRRQEQTLTAQQEHFQNLIEVRLIPSEETQHNLKASSLTSLSLAPKFVGIANVFELLPKIIGFSNSTGADGAAKNSKGAAEVFEIAATAARQESEAAQLKAGFQRRDETWDFELRQTNHKLNEIQKQIQGAEIQRDIAIRAKSIHEKNLEQTKEIHDFYVYEKFSSLGLYTWLSSTLQRLYREAYNSAYEMAKLAEQAYRFERNDTSGELIGKTHWKASRAGLLAGERLLIDLQALERKFIETNYRDLEINQSFSLMQFAPAALLALKAQGTCEFSIPELFFDLSYPGHYHRKIKAVRVTIPAVTGPYTNVSATLTLKGSHIRTDPSLDADLRSVPPTRTASVATSSAQGDAGVFELNFRDERYMPFEGAGANSHWQLDLPKTFRQFDYTTISDVILQISYTAQQDGALREQVEAENQAFAGNLQTYLQTNSLPRLFSLKHDFPTEWHQFASGSGDFTATVKKSYFPFFVQEPGQTLRLGAKAFLYSIKDEELVSQEIDLSADFSGGEECLLTISADFIDKTAQVFIVIPYSVSMP
jgi:hypothetical protein